MIALNHAVIALLGGFIAAAGVRTAAADSGESTAPGLVSEPIELTIAGRAARLRVVRDSRPPEQVVELAAAAWSALARPLRRDRAGPWLKLSRVDSDSIEVLQLRARPDGGSEGYLVNWGQPVVAPEPLRLDRLLPEGLRTIIDVGSAGGSRGRTLVVKGPMPIDELDRELLRRAASLGLRREQRAVLADSDPVAERTRFFAAADGTSVALTLHARIDGGSAMVIHMMEPDR